MDSAVGWLPLPTGAGEAPFPARATALLLMVVTGILIVFPLILIGSTGLAWIPLTVLAVGIVGSLRVWPQSVTNLREAPRELELTGDMVLLRSRSGKVTRYHLFAEGKGPSVQFSYRRPWPGKPTAPVKVYLTARRRGILGYYGLAGFPATSIPEQVAERLQRAGVEMGGKLKSIPIDRRNAGLGERRFLVRG
jgi:hypothetical protein